MFKLGLALLLTVLAAGSADAKCRASSGAIPRPVGMSDIFSQEAKAWPHYKDLGVNWLRVEFHWNYIERAPRRFDWANYDLVVSRANAAKIQLLGIVNHPPAWITESTLPGAVEKFGAELGRRYGTKVAAWEVFNEPNYPGFGWPFQSRDVSVAAMLYASTVVRFNEGLRSTDKTAIVVAGALSPSGFDPGAFVDVFFRTTPSACFDVLSLHPYGRARQMPQISATAKAILKAKYGSAKPVWFTEMGEDKENLIRQVMEDSFAQVPQVDGLFWFGLRDLQTRGWDFGVVEYDWAKKPLYSTLRNLVKKYSR